MSCAHPTTYLVIQAAGVHDSIWLCLAVQLPFKKAKYDVVIEERGLGELYGQRLTLRAEVSLSCHVFLTASVCAKLHSHSRQLC